MAKAKHTPAIFSADFETTTADLSESMTFVWLFAYVKIDDYADDNAVKIGYSIDQFIDDIENGTKFGHNDSIYFHNVKFDGSFIINGLFRRGYQHVDNIYDKSLPWDMKYFSTLISDMGVWYSITIKIGKRIIRIKNSACLIQGSVRSIGESFKTRKRKQEMDYSDAKLDPQDVTELDREYIRCDVQIMAEVLNFVVKSEGLVKLTAGANAMADYIERIGERNFQALFPELDKDVDYDIRPGYKGGWCYLNTKCNIKKFAETHSLNYTIYEDFKCGHRYYVDILGMTCDVNSLYPSIMHSGGLKVKDKDGNKLPALYPVGEPISFEGSYQYDEEHPLFIIKVKCRGKLKKRKFPCVQIKKSVFHNENEWLEEFGYPTHPGEEDGVDLVLTNVDLRLINECYDFEILSYNGGYKFAGYEGLFDEYIDYWANIKKTSKGPKRQLAKLMLNSFYGKFATRLNGASKIPYLSDEGVLCFKIGEEEERPGYYLPVGMFVTSYAREFTITAANANYDRFLYADTDSIHLIGQEPPAGVDIDPVELSCWKDEGYWDSAVFVRQKTYMEHTSEKGGVKEWEIRCAGMPENMRKGYLLDDKGEKVPDGHGGFKTFVKIDPNDFRIGLRFEKGKLLQKQVIGGCILVDTPFEIKAPE